MKNIITTLILLILTFSSVHSEGFYVGAKASQMDWDSAIMKGVTKQMQTRALLYNLFTNSRSWQFTDPSKISMKMNGVTASYIKERLSINYGFSTGNSNYEYSSLLVSISSPPLHIFNDYSETGYKVKRMDHDLSVSFLLSDTGFYAFAGLKAQSYNYDESFKFTYYQGTNSPTGITLPLNKPAYKLNFNSYGPAIGLGFTKVLSDNFSINASLGLIYMTSVYKNNGIQFYMSDLGAVGYRSDAQDLLIKGYTVNLSLNYKIGKGFLQFGLMRQDTSMQSSSNKYIQTVSASIGNYIPVETLIRQLFNINEKDVFQGISLGYQHNLF